MEKSNVIGFTGRDGIADPLTELLRQGARELIQQAVEAELAEFMAGYENRRLHDGRSAVVRNGYWPERSIQTGIGPVTVKVPKVRAKDGRAVAAPLVSGCHGRQSQEFGRRAARHCRRVVTTERCS